MLASGRRQIGCPWRPKRPPRACRARARIPDLPLRALRTAASICGPAGRDRTSTPLAIEASRIGKRVYRSCIAHLRIVPAAEGVRCELLARVYVSDWRVKSFNIIFGSSCFGVESGLSEPYVRVGLAAVAGLGTEPGTNPETERNQYSQSFQGSEGNDMTNDHLDTIFSGSIPELYQKYLVPLIFESYAQDMARRVAGEPVSRVLEVAAGTGALTRALADALDPSVSIVAIDLNQPMMDYGASVRVDSNVEWRKADALALPFADATFDVVACQLSVMFFADRCKSYSEARRVLKPGGRFIFSVWDKIEYNEFADIVTNSLAGVFPADPPLFLARTAYGHWDTDKIRVDLRKAGFTAAPSIETVAARSRASNPSIPAIAYCQGTPLSNEIESRDASLLKHATDVATSALSERFGTGAIDGKIQAHVLSIRA